MDIKIKLTREENLAHYRKAKGEVIALDLEREYLPICVSSEVYESDSRTPPAAKRAQAIAARTYITALALAGTVIDDTTNYQAFKWRALETIPKCAQAVRDTEGQVLVCGGALITAWYSNSNGGRTKRSDEAWSTYKPWTVSREDVWDVVGRAKWGAAPASHCVGMSQIGAAYAASIGIEYTDILGFYYVNTDIVGGYGKGNTIWKAGGINAVNGKTNVGLVGYARKYLGQPYWYGTATNPCTNSLLGSKTSQYPEHYTESRMPRYRDDIAKGKVAADCIGLVKGYVWEKNGKVGYDKNTDVNTSGLYNCSTVKGLIGTMPEVPGLIVYKTGHVGVYEGNGMVIEAKGFNYGVIRSRLSDTAWTHWIACPFIAYPGAEKLLEPKAFEGPYDAVVVTSVSPLNIWETPKKVRSLLQVPKGGTVRVIGYGGEMGWLKVEKNGVVGVADGQYLARANPVVVPDKPDDPSDADSNVDVGVAGDVLYRAKVVGVSIGLNLRKTPQKTEGNTILMLPLWAVVQVLADNLSGGFCFVRYGSVSGYCTGSYLEKLPETAGVNG